MKKEEIVITDKTIVLGIFETNTFIFFTDLLCLAYWNFSTVIDTIKANNVLEIVEISANWAEKIIFVLDDVQFPIDPSKSITCGELALICKNEQLFNKTVFVKGDNVIDFDRNLVI